MFTLEELDEAAKLVHASVPPTPAHHWPLLSEEAGAQIWVKHENHTPTGAFKVRGGIVLLDAIARRPDRPAGIISATRGNHGQSLAQAGTAAGFPVTIVVPEGNSPEKNAAMVGFSARLVVYGKDFDEAREHAMVLAERDGLEMVPPFHPLLVRGVATYAQELFEAVRDLDTVYVPIGMGSGIAGLITVRDLMGLRARIVGVVASGAPCYARSFAAGTPVSTDRVDTFADGVACRSPDPAAVEIICAGAADVIEVPDEATADAMRLLHRCTHNLPEPAGAIALAGSLAHRRPDDERIAVIMTGGNADTELYATVLSGATPSA